MYDFLIWLLWLYEKILVILGNDELEIYLLFLFFNIKSYWLKLLKKEMFRFCNDKIGCYVLY